MKLPTVDPATLNVQPIDWTGLDQRYMNPGELEILIALIRSVNPRGVLEIGVNSGRTAKAILDNVPGIEHYQGVDVLPGYKTERRVQRREVPETPGALAARDGRFELVLRSRGSLDLCAADLRPCDAVFIDGDHGRKAVTHDTKLARQLVRPGGIIIWHDYHDLDVVDVRAVLDELYDQGWPLNHLTNTWIAFSAG
ncbi:MAG TPA: class I SAM-dependent methyltransferase [Nevskiaceae bacterium]|nr:class I SAM-dependent methyltransferase [Nevskiaceae bacterium]